MDSVIEAVDGGAGHVSLRGTGDLRLAIVVNPALATGLLANTIGAIAIGLGAAQPGLGGVRLADQDGRSILTSADRPVPILQSDPQGLQALLAKAADRPAEAVLVAFPAFARALHSFAAYEDTFPTRDLKAEATDGLGVCGPAKWVKSLTGSLKLLR